ncbi:MAG: YggS family pyridoxal phosphate-dependent enzyme [Chitinophagaceae bacterium]
MSVNQKEYNKIISEFKDNNIRLVAVSKTKPIEDIVALYDLGQRDFGENYVQEMVDKNLQVKEADIRWHFIGHLQTNKVKYIAKFVHLIHSVDSLKLLQEINKQGFKNNICIKCLIQIYIATEETKFGLDEKEFDEIMNLYLNGAFKNVAILGVMGMASFSDDKNKVRAEFANLKAIVSKYPELSIISMGMSQDYKIAIEEGSNMVRIGSLLFGERNKI